MRKISLIVRADPGLAWDFALFKKIELVLNRSVIWNTINEFLSFWCLIKLFFLLEKFDLLQKWNNAFIHLEQYLSALVHKYIYILLKNRQASRRMIRMIFSYAFFAYHFIVILTVISDVNKGMLFAKDRNLKLLIIFQLFCEVFIN